MCLRLSRKETQRTRPWWSNRSRSWRSHLIKNYFYFHKKIPTFSLLYRMKPWHQATSTLTTAHHWMTSHPGAILELWKISPTFLVQFHILQILIQIWSYSEVFQKGLKNYQSQGTFICQSHETATLLVSFEGKLVSSCVTSVRGFGFAQIRIMGGFLDRNPGGKIRESVTFSIIIKISSQRIAQMKGPDDSTKIK